MNHLKIQKAVLVGHSMGSLIVLDAAARHPQRVERIALIAVAYPMKVTEAFLDAARRNDFAAFDMHTIWGHAAQVPLGGNPNPGMWMYGDTLARLRRLAPGVLHNDLKASNDYVFSGTVQCPVLLILGKRDVMTPPRSAQALQEKLSDARVEVVEISGHSLMAEAPDATLDALIRFLAH
jgi:pimeloyl-ACP methyl ester carboxylesterase